MKRMFVAIALIAAIAGLAIYGNATVKDTLGSLDRKLESAAKLCTDGDYESAFAELADFQQELTDKKLFFGAFIHQEYYYALTESSATLMSYNNDETKLDMLAELARCREQIAMIYESWFRLV